MKEIYHGCICCSLRTRDETRTAPRSLVHGKWGDFDPRDSNNLWQSKSDILAITSFVKMLFDGTHYRVRAFTRRVAHDHKAIQSTVVAG